MKETTLSPAIRMAFAHNPSLLGRISAKIARERRLQERAETESAQDWYEQYRQTPPGAMPKKAPLLQEQLELPF